MRWSRPGVATRCPAPSPKESRTSRIPTSFASSHGWPSKDPNPLPCAPPTRSCWPHDPDDGEALKQVGALDYVESRFSQAKARLGRYIANGGGDFATDFSFAEILARDGEHARARAHFERSLAEIARFEQPTPHMRTIQALALHRVGRTADAFAAFEALLAEYPENEHLRADYVGALLQSTRYAEAALCAE